MLKDLVGSACPAFTGMGGNATADNSTAAGNATEINFQLPAAYAAYINGLGNIDFSPQQSFNNSDDFLTWDTTRLKSWIFQYINYHNSVANSVQQTPQGAFDVLVGAINSVFGSEDNQTS